MSPKLKPLLLPQLVEQRRKHEGLVQLGSTESGQTFIYYTHHSSSSSSDLASPSPLTESFSRNHPRYAGSTSSLDQIPSSYPEGPASPTQSNPAPKGAKSVLPDVQEEPVREDEDTTTVADDHFGLYDCLCDEPCVHRGVQSPGITTISHLGTDIDYYDLGFLSDSDFCFDDRSKRTRTGEDSAFTGLTHRVSTKLSGISRWRSSKKSSHHTFSPASDPALDQGGNRSRAASRAASSRSSSISALARHFPDRSNEPRLPPTPALSFYDSTDSIVPPDALDTDQADVRKSLERERALATTPLLPPLLVENPAFSAPPSLQASPLQSPTIASLPLQESAPLSYATPPLSSKPSLSSFRPAPGMISPALVSPVSELPSPIPNLIEHDEWSDRLGHANFTILPRPYQPTLFNLEALRTLRTDWDLAKVNYTKHLCRTGEHYGMTSNTYALTQAKWADIEREWSTIETDLVDRIAREGGEEADSPELHRRGRQESVQPAVIPKMLEGKFPERGDVDIVGPMQRDAVMLRDVSPIDDKKHVSAWLKSLAGKVGLRK